MSNPPKEITFDLAQAKRLKKAYDKAVANEVDQFEFEGLPWVTGYAKYLIEYLETQFREKL
jgi:hypothetical protein